jgi:hypothetical protein
MALAVLLLAAKAKFPVPLASAVLLLNATAMPEPVVVAVLLPNCTTVFPETETARPPLVVACDELVSSGEALASAHADGAPMPSATRGAPAHAETLGGRFCESPSANGAASFGAGRDRVAEAKRDDEDDR